jgi:hypothetical protein
MKSNALLARLPEINIELWFSRTWIIMAAGFVAAINMAAVVVLYTAISHWRADLSKDLNTNIWISAVVVVVLNVIVLGGMNVGQFFRLVTDGADGIAWLCAAVLIPLITGKTISKYTSTKFGSTDVPPDTTKPGT